MTGLGNKRVFGNDGPFTLTGTTAETALATIPLANIPAQSLIRVTTQWTNNNNANDKTNRIRLGGLSGAVMGINIQTTIISRREQRDIVNRGSTQVGFPGGTGGWATSSSSPASASVNLVTGADLVLSGQLADAGDTLTLEYYLVEVILFP
jgi:hypothetical protein